MTCSPRPPRARRRGCAARSRARSRRNRRGYTPEWTRRRGDAGTALHASWRATWRSRATASTRCRCACSSSSWKASAPACCRRSRRARRWSSSCWIPPRAMPPCRRAAGRRRAAAAGAVARRQHAAPPPPRAGVLHRAGNHRDARHSWRRCTRSIRRPIATPITARGTAGDFAVFDGDAAGAAPPVSRSRRAVQAHRRGRDRAVVRLRRHATGRRAGAGQRPLLLDWEYLSADGWLPLDADRGRHRALHAATARSRWQSAAGRTARTIVVAGIASCWIRATVSAARRRRASLAPRTPPMHRACYAVQVESSIELLAGDVVTIDGSARATVRNIFGNSLRLDAPLGGAHGGRISRAGRRAAAAAPEGVRRRRRAAAARRDPRPRRLRQTDLALDSAYLDGSRSTSARTSIRSASSRALFAAFYLACKNAFSRTGARIELAFDVLADLSRIRDGTASAPRMQAEYYSGGAGWRSARTTSTPTAPRR